MAEYSDEGTKYTDKAERRLNALYLDEYSKAYRTICDKLRTQLEGFNKKDIEFQQRVQAGMADRDEWIAWRKKQIIYSGRLQKQAKSLAKVLTETDINAAKQANETLPSVFSENANYMLYSTEADTFTYPQDAFTIYNENAVENLLTEHPEKIAWVNVKEGKDQRYNQKQIRGAITQGILLGESIDKITKRLLDVTNGDLVAARRRARTALTGAQNSGRVTGFEDAEKLGINVQKQWLATHDLRTRFTHAQADGQIVPYDDPFIVGGFDMMYPGDPEAPAEEIMNCRCTVIGVLDGQDNYGRENAWSRGDMSYEEWKVMYGLQGFRQ